MADWPYRPALQWWFPRRSRYLSSGTLPMDSFRIWPSVCRLQVSYAAAAAMRCEQNWISCFLVDFDKLGLTDNENPYGVLPPLLARSMGRAAGNFLADYIGNILDRRRGKRWVFKQLIQQVINIIIVFNRSTEKDIPKPAHTGHLQGGERALLYMAVEELLENFGMDGKACLLRAICEVHAHPMQGFGLLGEMLKLFLR